MKNLFKVIAAIIFTIGFILFIIFLSSNGAFAKSKAEAPLLYEGRMKYAGCSKNSAMNLYVWIDTETGVCYCGSTGYGKCLTVLVDHNGDPYIANGWRDYDE